MVSQLGTYIDIFRCRGDSDVLVVSGVEPVGDAFYNVARSQAMVGLHHTIDMDDVIT